MIYISYIIGILHPYRNHYVPVRKESPHNLTILLDLFPHQLSKTHTKPKTRQHAHTSTSALDLI